MTVVKILAHLQFLTPTLLMSVLFRVGSLIKTFPGDDPPRHLLRGRFSGNGRKIFLLALNSKTDTVQTIPKISLVRTPPDARSSCPSQVRFTSPSSDQLKIFFVYVVHACSYHSTINNNWECK